MMNTNTLKANTLFKKAIAAALAAALAAAMAIGIAAGFSTQKVQAAEETVISDIDATAHINADGSGYIEFDYRAYSEDEPLVEVGGVPLKDIITFNDGGYIDQFYTEEKTGDMSDMLALIYPYSVHVHGAGPSGFCSGAGYLHFADESGDSYGLVIWSSSIKWHWVKYNSSKPAIVKLSWNS